MADVQLRFAAANLTDIKDRISAPTCGSSTGSVCARVLTILKLFNTKSRRLAAAASRRCPLPRSAHASHSKFEIADFKLARAERTRRSFEVSERRFQTRGRRALFPEVLVEEIRGGVIGGEPGAMPQEIMNLVGKDKLLEFHLLFPQRLHQADHFGERHVSVIIPLHQQHG